MTPPSTRFTPVDTPLPTASATVTAPPATLCPTEEARLPTELPTADTSPETPSNADVAKLPMSSKKLILDLSLLLLNFGD